MKTKAKLYTTFAIILLLLTIVFTFFWVMNSPILEYGRTYIFWLAGILLGGYLFSVGKHHQMPDLSRRLYLVLSGFLFFLLVVTILIGIIVQSMP